MLSASLSSSGQPLFLCNKQILSLKTPPCQSRLLNSGCFTVCFSPLSLRVSTDRKEMLKKNRGGFGAVCYSPLLTPRNFQWISTVSSAILMLARGTAIQKSFLVPFFALQAPASIVSWIKGEYGIWIAFLTLLVNWSCRL
ncbi:unnamed protein product [Ilex paraguariensis]|uniref:Uncharacterized protein n=1 Tax=Ilex paraguariensis TaxID=185542 RepID=A0ABC8R6U0_9AQUA